MNENFFKIQIFDILIRIIILSFQIRDLNINRHENEKYVIFDIYIFNTKNDKKIILLFKRKMYFVNNLKTNIFLNNNIINFKNFTIDIIKRQIIIVNIDIIVVLKIRFFKLTI